MNFNSDVFSDLQSATVDSQSILFTLIYSKSRWHLTGLLQYLAKLYFEDFHTPIITFWMYSLHCTGFRLCCFRWANHSQLGNRRISLLEQKLGKSGSVCDLSTPQPWPNHTRPSSLVAGLVRTFWLISIISTDAAVTLDPLDKGHNWHHPAIFYLLSRLLQCNTQTKTTGTPFPAPVSKNRPGFHRLLPWLHSTLLLAPHYTHT